MSKQFINFQDKTVTWGQSTFDITQVYAPQGLPDTHPFRRAVSTISNYESAADSLVSALGQLAASAHRDIEKLDEGMSVFGIAPNSVAHILQYEQKIKDLAEQANLFMSMVPGAELDRLRLS